MSGSRAHAGKDDTQADLRALARHLQDTLEAERQAIANDVHDQIGAMLTGIGMKLANLAEAMPPSDRQGLEGLRDLTALVESALASTREICARLRPSMLDDVGLVEACRWYVRDWSRTTGVRVSMRASSRKSSPRHGCALDIYRILQELLTNVARHSGSRTARVSLSCGRPGIRLRVADDGTGFGAGGGRGFGLAGVRERARRYDGRVDVATGPLGTVITVTIPGEGKP
jgi:signal transduction histidine kinase